MVMGTQRAYKLWLSVVKRSIATMQAVMDFPFTPPMISVCHAPQPHTSACLPVLSAGACKLSSLSVCVRPHL